MTGILDLVTVVLLRALVELQRELRRRGLNAEQLLEQADGQTKANEAAFQTLLDAWNTRK